MLILFWPLIMITKRCWSEIQFATSYGQKSFEKQLKRQEHMIISSRARLIEVCIESSFQPLLQLYLLLPTLIYYFECGAYQELSRKPLSETLSRLSGLQLMSVVTSVICLSLSFLHYKVTQKSGALDYNANPVGRVCLLISTFLQVSCILIVFVFLLSFRGESNGLTRRTKLIYILLLFSRYHVD